MTGESVPWLYTYVGEVVYVVDGDTFDAIVDLGFHVSIRVRFRLLGIDTPEIHGISHDSEEYQRGIAAKKFVEDLILGKQVMITSYKTGKYGRWLADVKLPDGRDLAIVLREAGYAKDE